MPEWLKKALYGLVFLILGLYLLIFLHPVNPGQQAEDHQQKVDPKPLLGSMEFDLDSLRELYGINKELPEGYEAQALLALSAFPELKNIRVSFTLNDESAALEANFKLATLFGSRENRHYNILINNQEG